MNMHIECADAKEVNAALAVGDIAVVRFPDWITIRGSAHVEAWGSAHVVASGSAHVVARESAHIVARESAHVVASKLVTVHRHGSTPVVTGGVIIQVDPPKSPAEWLDFYGIQVIDGIAVLFKGLDDKFVSPHGMSYAPGTTPSAPDWDGGREECGGGLHFSPTPFMATEFAPEATHFVACPVLVSEIVVHEYAMYPSKVKAPRCIAPVWEVDIYG
jgi:hypothetical protein